MFETVELVSPTENPGFGNHVVINNDGSKAYVSTVSDTSGIVHEFTKEEETNNWAVTNTYEGNLNSNFGTTIDVSDNIIAVGSNNGAFIFFVEGSSNISKTFFYNY